MDIAAGSSRRRSMATAHSTSACAPTWAPTAAHRFRWTGSSFPGGADHPSPLRPTSERLVAAAIGHVSASRQEEADRGGGSWTPASSRPGGPSGLQPAPAPPTVRVTVHPRPKPIVLVLGAYDAVRWTLSVEPGATLQRVIAQGYKQQDVLGVPDGVPIESLDGENATSIPY